jgi:acyl-CoA synthetase (AMP-forming)/AMP-acid ligase II
VGLHDAEWGQRVVALCVLDPCDSTPPRERLLLVHQALSARLARFKQPKSYALVSTLPASALGKILRAELPALYAGAPETFEARELG